MYYLIEKLDGDVVVRVERRETERQAIFCAMYQPPGEYRVRQGDRLICLVSTGSRVMVHST